MLPMSKPLGSESPAAAKVLAPRLQTPDFQPLARPNLLALSLQATISWPSVSIPLRWLSGGDTKATIPWRRSYGDDPMATIPWRRFYCDDRMAAIPRRRSPGDYSMAIRSDCADPMVTWPCDWRRWYVLYLRPPVAILLLWSAFSDRSHSARMLSPT